MEKNSFSQKGIAGIFVFLFFLIFAVAGGYLIYLVYTGQEPSEAINNVVSRYVDPLVNGNGKSNGGVNSINGGDGENGHDGTGNNGGESESADCSYKGINIINGKTYTFDEGCNVCLCSNGVIYCSDRVCSPTSLSYYSEWNDYIDENGVAFKYPADWQVSKRDYDKSLTTGNISQKTYYYAVSNGAGYVVEFYVPQDPKIIDSIECRYDDSTGEPRFGEFEAYLSYESVNDGITYVRRSYNPETKKYYICKSVRGIYIRTIRLNKVEYIVPELEYIDKNIVSDMDYIVFSFDNAEVKN